MSSKPTRYINGYVVVYDPTNPRAMKSSNWLGYVYEHIKVAGESLGRPVASGEVVHHLDGNRANNRTENLLVLLNGEHLKLHMWLERAGIEQQSTTAARTCVVCGCTLQRKQRHTCSPSCDATRKARTSARPTEAELCVELVVGTSFCALGRKYNVSDNTVRQWARGYGLI